MAWKNMTSAQRLWTMFASVLLLSTLAVIAAAWPKQDPAVVSAFRTPECQAWLATSPERMTPEARPKCGALQAFLEHDRVDVRSEADYDSYLVTKRIKTVAILLAAWAGFLALIYGLGKASVVVVRSAEQRRQRKNVTNST